MGSNPGYLLKSFLLYVIYKLKNCLVLKTEGFQTLSGRFFSKFVFFSKLIIINNFMSFSFRRGRKPSNICDLRKFLFHSMKKVSCTVFTDRESKAKNCFHKYTVTAKRQAFLQIHDP